MNTNVDDINWDKILAELISFIASKWSRSAERRQSVEDAAQSALKSAFKIADKNGVVVGDPEFYDLLYVAARRKTDTARHHYRTGHGKSATHSALSGEEFNFSSSIPDEANAEFNSAEDHQDIFFQRFQFWIEENVGNLSEIEQKAAFAWLRGLTVDEMSEELSMPRAAILRARHAIRTRFGDREEQN